MYPEAYNVYLPVETLPHITSSTSRLVVEAPLVSASRPYLPGNASTSPGVTKGKVPVLELIVRKGHLRV